MKTLRNPAFILVIVSQLFFITVHCRLSRKEGYILRNKPAPDFAIIYNSFSACGAAFLSERWLMTGYNCMYTRLGMREKRRARNVVKPYIRAVIKETNTCGDECGIAIVKVDKDLKHDSNQIEFSRIVFSPMMCTQPVLFCGTVKLPFNANSSVDVYHKVLVPVDDSRRCWLEDDYFYKNQYLCAQMGPVAGPTEDFTMCKKASENTWSDKELFLDGPYMCRKNIYGFFNWKSCDKNNHVAFGNLTKYQEYLRKHMPEVFTSSGDSGDSGDWRKEGGDANVTTAKSSEDVSKPIADEPKQEEEAQKTQDEVTETSGGSYNNAIKIWIVSTLAFLLCVKSV